MALPPFPEYPPLLDPVWAAYIGVVATILIGIFFTKDDKRNFENIVSNIVSFALLLVAVQFTWFTLLIMSLYLIIGVIIAIEKVKKWFFLFGSKTYGPLALMILLASDGYFGFKFATLEFPITWVVLENMALILVGWAILASIAHAICYYYYKTPSAKRKKKETAADALRARLQALISSKVSKKKSRSRSKKRQRKNGKRSSRRTKKGKR
jgi:hypothetical protein